MDVDEITRKPLERFERSPKTQGDKKNCIWACAMRLMEAHDPEASAHVSMIGHRIGLNEYEISSATRNAARRTGWADAKPAKPESPDVREIGDNSDDPWDMPPVNPAPEACKTPDECPVHALPGDWWPSDFPDCPHCSAAEQWFMTHELDHRSGRYVAK